MVEGKSCEICKEYKSIKDFYEDSSIENKCIDTWPRGIFPKCKKCIYLALKEKYKEDHQEIYGKRVMVIVPWQKSFKEYYKEHVDNYDGRDTYIQFLKWRVKESV